MKLPRRRIRVSRIVVALCALWLAGVGAAQAEDSAQPLKRPMLSPDIRARWLLKQMTLDEKISLVHGVFAMPMFGPLPAGAIGSAGFVAGVPRLGIPALQETDASLGIANPDEVRPGDTATALPSSLALAATWNPDLAYQSGAMIGDEAWRKGFNVLLAGGVNLARDPRNGRNFEYLGEDALLAGALAGRSIAGVQSRYVVSTIKHFALNDQETGRHMLNAVIDEAAARESDLLAFELAIEIGQPGSVMCAYNQVDGDYACENAHLLTDILRRDWNWRGWVMSDWGAVSQTVKPALAGLDQESGQQLDKKPWFSAGLHDAVDAGEVPPARLDEMVSRILRSEIDIGLFEYPPVKQPIDYDAHAVLAQRVAEQGIVLLKNRDGTLPLRPGLKRIAVIGAHADIGVLSGGGSAQVIPVGGAALSETPPDAPWKGVKMIYDPSSPLRAIRTAAPEAEVSFDSGADPAAAARLAGSADIAIVFADQWMTEGLDAPDLSLPHGQDELIEAVAAANPHTIVVLETGGAVTLPWLPKVAGLIEAWYPGARGGEAIVRILFGAVNPSGRLPVSFPVSADQLPRPRVPTGLLASRLHFDVDYTEGARVGYRWYRSKDLTPQFPFGYGLSYTRFDYGQLTVEGGDTASVAFDVTNSGERAGAEVAQVYAAPAGAPPGAARLIGWRKVDLQPGESQRVAIHADPRLLARWDDGAHRWRIDGGDYAITVGGSAIDDRLKGIAALQPKLMAP